MPSIILLITLIIMEEKQNMPAEELNAISNCIVTALLVSELHQKLAERMGSKDSVVLFGEEDNGSVTCLAVPIECFNKLFPNIVGTDRGEYFFCNRTYTKYLHLDIDSEFAKKTLSEEKLNRLKKDKPESKGVTVYHLIINNKICHTFNTRKKAIEKMKEDNVDYLLYTPPVEME
jgi:hypothetical protein